MTTKAIILFSGGLDSTVMLAQALAEGKTCYLLSFFYGQRHAVELKSAANIAEHYRVAQKTIHIDLSWMHTSSLLSEMTVPQGRTLEKIETSGIPSTYVPARNTLFLSYAAGLAEVLGADEIHFGCNQNDLTAYPDCRPDYIAAIQTTLNLATKSGREGRGLKIVTPLAALNKAGIVSLARQLNVPIEMTWSCYSPTISETPCGTCDACYLRQMAL